jgi:hypothetical protein
MHKSICPKQFHVGGGRGTRSQLQAKFGHQTTSPEWQNPLHYIQWFKPQPMNLAGVKLLTIDRLVLICHCFRVSQEPACKLYNQLLSLLWQALLAEFYSEYSIREGTAVIAFCPVNQRRSPRSRVEGTDRRAFLCSYTLLPQSYLKQSRKLGCIRCPQIAQT